MLVKPLCVFVVESQQRVPGGARLHEFARHIELNVAVEPIDRLDGGWRDQHALPKPPIASLDDEIANAPIRAIEHEILDMADFAVNGMNAISYHFDDAAQMRIGFAQSRAPPPASVSSAEPKPIYGGPIRGDAIAPGIAERLAPPQSGSQP